MLFGWVIMTSLMAFIVFFSLSFFLPCVLLGIVQGEFFSPRFNIGLGV